MKNHQRSISQELKIFKQNVAISQHHPLDILAKNIHKKPPQQSTHSHLPKQLDPYRRTEPKHSPLKSESKPKSNRQKSLQKFLSHQRPTQRSSLNPPSRHNTLTTKTKMVRINGVLNGKTSGDSKEQMGQMYHRYDDYLALLKQWGQSQLLEEVDNLVRQLIDSYLSTFENVMGEMCIEMGGKLKKYEEMLVELEQQNKKLQYQLDAFANIDEMVYPIRQRVMEEYQKSQWSTFVLNAMALKSFDIQEFVKEMPLYKKWVAGVVGRDLRREGEARGQEGSGRGKGRPIRVRSAKSMVRSEKMSSRILCLNASTDA